MLVVISFKERYSANTKDGKSYDASTWFTWSALEASEFDATGERQKGLSPQRSKGPDSWFDQIGELPAVCDVEIAFEPARGENSAGKFVPRIAGLTRIGTVAQWVGALKPSSGSKSSSTSLPKAG